MASMPFNDSLFARNIEDLVCRINLDEEESAGFSVLLFYVCAFGWDYLCSGDLTTTESMASSVVRSKTVGGSVVALPLSQHCLF